MKKRVFSKSLTHTDIAKRLSIPTKSLALLPGLFGGNAMELKVKDKNGRSWNFVCSLRKAGYAKPVLQKGWRDFVVAKGLAVGDKVTIYQQECSEHGIKVFGVVFPCSCYSIEVERVNQILRV
ncbi:hypothetical protein COLO4_29046 [Corchorus olitorius]|uniref:TF-B3 domain-containing protein n=1 Tax=Corchorus olitorius TaxID=93759 RepID=A0A1R3HGQ9_9ROSI|nr:hypothetical protein COLO4_29046 [Corchorus olitorius]